MLLWTRKILFYIFLLMYLIITPYAILYGLGYVFNPKEEMALVSTGLISISTHPKNVTALLNGQKLEEKTPSVITDLKPATYHLKLEAEGYQPWEKDIEVKAEKAAALKPVILLSQNPKIKTFSKRAYRGMAPFLVDSKILAWQGETMDTLWKIDLFFKRETHIGKEIPGAASLKILNVSAKHNSSLVLFEAEQNGHKGFWAYDMERENSLLNLTPWVSGKPDDLIWDPKNAGHLYFLKDGKLGRVDLTKGEGHPQIASDVVGAGFRNSKLYLLKNDFSLITSNERAENPEPLIEDKETSRKIFETNGNSFFRIEVLRRDLLRRDLLLFWGSAGTLITNRLPYTLVEKEVKGEIYGHESENEKILYWTDHQIGVIDFTRDPESLFEKGPEKFILYEKGDDIRQAMFAFEDTHVVLADGETIYLLEAKDPAPYLLREIGRTGKKDPVIYQERSNAVFYLDAKTRFLMKRELAD